MSNTLSQWIRFRHERLFDGAVDTTWLVNNPAKAAQVAQAYVFHGPTYHGVSQAEVGLAHGHRLVDSASFLLDLLRRCHGQSEQPFTLAIAGYGTGKSHLALTLAALLQAPQSPNSQEILNQLAITEPELARQVQNLLHSLPGPALVLAFNGMENFDLAAEGMRQIARQLRQAGLDTKALEELRPRFQMALNLLKWLTLQTEVQELALACGAESIESVRAGLENFDEAIYAKVHGFFKAKGLPIQALGDETIKDVLNAVCQEYCGPGKPFGQVVILFDEFGRYAEFATIRSQVAGSGVLQHLFEGVQNNFPHALFVGFIQFELNTYVQRISSEYRNEILRVVTRYQSAAKAFLSLNLETLLAHLLEKLKPDALRQYFEQPAILHQTPGLIQSLHRWFPRSAQHRLWCETAAFHQMVRQGCWPLSPYAAWFLFHLAAAGQHLQQRSVLALLAEALTHQAERSVPSCEWELAAVDLWSEALQAELLTAEEGGSLGTVTLSYASVMARHADKFTHDEQRLLRALVLSAKLGAVTANREEATQLLAALAGIQPTLAATPLRRLEQEYNIIAWDEGFRQFEILGDTVSKPQFLKFLHQRTAAWDERTKAQLFIRFGQEWGVGLFADPGCDFAEGALITTQEWRFHTALSSHEELRSLVEMALQRWKDALSVEAPRGTLIYCYLEPSSDPEKIQAEALKLLRTTAKGAGVKDLPLLLVFLHDAQGKLGQTLAELTVITEQLTEQEKLKFGNLVGAYRESSIRIFRESAEALLKERRYLTSWSEPFKSSRLSAVCSEVLKRIYPQVLPFPFDGFSTAKGNAAETCKMLTHELLSGALSFDTITNKPVKDKNRALQVLQHTWQIFSKNAEVTRKPANPIVRAIFESWEGLLVQDKALNWASALALACAPPFGANLASAGLLLGVYFRARKTEMALIDKGQPVAWPELAESLFKGKFLDPARLSTVAFIPIDKSGLDKWDQMLEEWEQACLSSYGEMHSAWRNAQQLKQHQPLPSGSGQIFRYENLEMKSQQGIKKHDEFQNRVDNAIETVMRGEEKRNVRELARGAIHLLELAQKIAADPLFEKKIANECQVRLEIGRQRIIQWFDEWLRGQSPDGRSTHMVATYEQKMRETGRHLKELKLTEPAEKLERHVAETVKRLNEINNLKELINDMALWLDGVGTLERITRVSELRQRGEMARERKKRLGEALKKFDLPEIPSLQTRLEELAEGVQTREKAIRERMLLLWKTKLTPENLPLTLAEVTDLERFYENCESDLVDLRTMRRALELYQSAYQKLVSEALSEAELTRLHAQLLKEAEHSLGDEELPWPPKEVFKTWLALLQKKRQSLAHQWIEDLEAQTQLLEALSEQTAVQILQRLQSPPAYLGQNELEKVAILLERVETHSEALSIEWLFTKFQALGPNARKIFLKRIRG